jgi:hypothetical protein
MAISFGAFFFTFGLPALAQENHAQLAYRFGIPLACYFFWRFFEQPRINSFLATVFWTVWQFFCSIYLGIFLVLLLIALTILAPLFTSKINIKGYVTAWPGRIWQAWVHANWKQRGVGLVLVGVILFSLWILLAPYYMVTVEYGFLRKWKTVSALLPVWQSYLLADNSFFWHGISMNINDVNFRWEHQLFPGIALTILIAAGLIFRFRSRMSRIAWLMFWAGVILILLTMNINGFSFYQIVWRIKGVNSIRAVTRIILVLMWPQAIFAAWSLNAIIQNERYKTNWRLALAFILLVLLLAESIFYTHLTYKKAESVARIEQLTQQVPANLPKKPVLSVAYTGNIPDYVHELDVMLMAQQLGYPTMNGYSGNFPPGYNLPENCYQIVTQLKSYSRLLIKNREQQKQYYLETIKHIVPIGFSDCSSVWWNHIP